MKEAYYFSHDANARHDPKITAMRGVYGSEGYGWYWMLVEMMRESSDYKLDIHSKYTFNAFALQLQGECNRIKEFVHDCIGEFELFSSDGQYFWSESLLRRMQFKDEKSEKRRQAANKRWEKERKEKKESEKDANGMQLHEGDDAIAMQEKERKEKERKENIYTIFEHWNSKKIIAHKTLTDTFRSHINARLDDGYKVEDILSAIDNYDMVLKSDEHYFSHKFAIKEFMNPKNLDKFLSENNPFENFAKNREKESATKKATYEVDPEDIEKAEIERWMNFGEH